MTLPCPEPERVSRRLAPMPVGWFAPNMPADEWDAIREFVFDSLAACDGRVPSSARVLIPLVAPLVHWAWLNGMPLERDTVFRRATIGRFIEQAYPGCAKSTRNTYRARLLRMGEVLAPDHQDQRLPGLARDFQSIPYNDSEHAMLRSWANGQRTVARRTDAGILLALGMGAGLIARELADIKHKHINVDDDGVLVTVEGKRARTVPVLKAWEDALIESNRSNRDPEAYLFRPKAGRHIDNANNITAHFIYKHGKNISPSRMRSTWIAVHLASGVPAKALLKISGMDGFGSFARIIPYLPEPDLDQARTLFRG